MIYNTCNDCKFCKNKEDNTGTCTIRLPVSYNTNASRVVQLYDSCDFLQGKIIKAECHGI